ncbi:AMP-binding protein [Geofilum sp. OHC36d9]|uniref:AMP-binding protein n=1 Tax=Geofilum sp. OHC36d9 TaxID=3458413 RepID=UPI00403444B1
MLKNRGEKIAITFGQEKISYRNLMGKTERYSTKLNIGKEEHVVIYSENRPAWFYALYAVWNLQGVVIPIDFGSTTQEISYILKDCQPSVVYVSNEGHDKMLKAIEQADILTRIIIIDEDEEYDSTCVSDGEVIKPSLDATALIIYTSGTTGNPKGVVLSYGNLITNIIGVSEKIPIYTPDSRTMILLPLHHILPLLGSLIAPMYVGGMAAICPSMASEDIMRTLQDNKITIIIGVPRLYAAIRKGITDKINASAIARMLFNTAARIHSQAFSKLVFGAVHRKFGGAVKFLVSGGAPLDPEVGTDYQTLGFEVLEGYGMTEAAPMVTFTRPGRVKIGSPGEVLPGSEIKIVDNEITVRGGNIMKGYYNRPDETAHVLKGGWLQTGDLGYIDEKGYLFITGRKKEIIVTSNGKNINPVELEEKLLMYKEVDDCGVFLHENQLHAIIVPNHREIQSENIMEAVRNLVIAPFNNTVSSYKRILKIHTTDEELPRTRLGKLQRFKLQDYAIEEQVETEQEEAPQSEEFKLIANYLEQEKGRKVRASHHPELDLGLDSLDRVALQAYLYQSFGVDIEANNISQFKTIGELCDFVAEKKTKMEDGGIDWKEILKEKVHLNLPVSWLPTTIMMRLSKLIFKLYFRFRAKGMENIPSGPCIIAPNHQSFFDGLFVTGLLRTKQIRKTYFYAKAQHVKKPVLKFLADKNNVIVVDLNRNLKESIQKMAEVLKRQKNLIIFPEGTRSINGNLGQFKKTFAILSRELNIPIVPVSIKGAIDALPKGSIFPRPWKKIHVEFLQPVYPANKSYDHISDLVRDRIQANM